MNNVYFDKENPMPEPLMKQLSAVLQPIFDFNRRSLPKEGVIKRQVEFTVDGELFLDNILGNTTFIGSLTLKHDGVVKMHVPVRGDATRE